jgi:clan AA aspartic protease
MIKGYFDNENHPRLKLEVSGSDAKIKIPALIDTGFDGSLSLPISIAIQLGLKLVNTTIVGYADGSSKQELIFQGKVKIGKDKEKHTPIFVASTDEALVGTQLLKDYILEINFARQKITLAI